MAQTPSPRRGLLVAVVLVGLVALAVPIASADHDVCGDVLVVGARGSGQAVGAEGQEVDAFATEMRDLLGVPDLVVSTHELGSVPYTTSPGTSFQYPAVPIGADSAQTIINSLDAELEGLRGEYDGSVAEGVAEAAALLTDRAAVCPNEAFVLMGYSQGAQTIGDALFELDAETLSQVVHVTFLGDPKFEQGGPRVNLPFISQPFGCAESRPWERGTADCFELGGILEPRVPYVPSGLEERVASWCQDGDAICTGNPLDLDSGVHSTYDVDVVPAAAAEAARAVDDYLAEFDLDIDFVTFKDGLPTGLYTVFVIDTTGSMADDIAGVRGQALVIADQVLQGIDLPFGLTAPGNIALVEYRDHGDAFVSRVVVPFTRDRDQFAAGLDGLVASGGGDFAEAVYSGLFSAFDELDWGFLSRKTAVLIGDAPAKDPEPVTGYTLAQVSRRAAELDPVNVFPISLSTGSTASFQAIADATDGELSTASASTIGNVVIDAITDFALDPVAVMPVRYFALPGQPITFSATGSFDVDADIVAYRWDFDLDGVVDRETTTPTTTFTYHEPYEDLAKVTVVSSDGGIGTATTQVVVADDAFSRLQPAPATGVVAAAGTAVGQVEVSWQASTDAVAGYRLYLDDGTFLGATTGAATSMTVPGLDPGRSVQVYVVAHGPTGLGTPAASNAVIVPGGSREASIDVRPGSDDNPVNLRSKGVLPLAVLAEGGLDPTSIDQTSIEIGPGGAVPVHDLSRSRGHAEDVDGDGDVDLVLHANIGQLGLVGDETRLCVRLRTADGTAWEGCDAITVTPP